MRNNKDRAEINEIKTKKDIQDQQKVVYIRR